MFLIRKATRNDLSRVAEIFVFNNRINYFPIFGDEKYSFGELQVVSVIENYFGKAETLDSLYIYDENGVVKGFTRMRESEIIHLYVDPFFQSGGIGSRLIDFAARELGANGLWALQKNVRAISFYEKHGFHVTETKKFEEGTTEYLVWLTK